MANSPDRTAPASPSASPDLTRIAAIIPAWEPEERLVALVDELAMYSFAAILVVDDGSRPECRPIFDQVDTLPCVRVLQHAVNLGKGRALKTAFNHILTDLPEVWGVVTADADGQHTVVDIVRVAHMLAQMLAQSGARPVLGVRAFDNGVPLRSQLGNTLTRYVFWFLAGRRVGDTQSGLRGFPVRLLAEMMPLKGERYEYEMNVLAHLCRRGLPPVEVPIETVYIDQNRASHFDPVLDSMRIYFVLLRFYASSLISAGIDFVGFSLAYRATGSIATAVLVGRLSSVANFMLNKRFVFHSGISVGGTLWRYYLLVVVMAGIAYGTIRSMSSSFGWNVIAAKIVVETILSLASFALQRTFVFPPGEDESV